MSTFRTLQRFFLETCSKSGMRYKVQRKRKDDFPTLCNLQDDNFVTPLHEVARAACSETWSCPDVANHFLSDCLGSVDSALKKIRSTRTIPQLNALVEIYNILSESGTRTLVIRKLKAPLYREG